MKKYMIRILTVLCLVCFGAAMFVGCKEEQKEPPVEDTQYTVTYAAGGGTGTAPAVEKYKEGDTFKVKENPFSKEGSTFKTWNDGSKDYAPGADYTMPKKNVTFTAQWEENGTKPEPEKEQVTVTFDLGENTEGKVPAAKKVNKGEEYTLPAAPAWEGHLFTGWKVGNEVKKAGEKITPTADVTLIAQYKEVSYSLTGATIETTEDTAYVVLAGTYEGYTDDEMKDLLENSDQAVLKFSLCIGQDPWTYQEPDVVIEVEDGTFTVKLDVTDFDPQYPYFVTANRSGSGDIKTLTVETSGVAGGKKYSLKSSNGSTLTLTISEAGKEYAFTAMKVEAVENKVYLTVSGTYSGYTDDEFKSALEDNDKNVLYVGLTATAKAGDLEAWNWPICETTVTAANGTFAIKLDITEIPIVIYYICENQSGSGDIKWNEAFASTVTANGKKYTVEENAYHNTQLNVAEATEPGPEPPVEKAFTVTNASIAIENETKVVITLSGTFAGYTKEEFKTAIEDTDDTNVGFRIINAGKPDWSKVAGPTSNEVGDGTFAVKFDVTAFEARSYYVNRQQGTDTDIKGVSYDNTVTLGEKSYQLHDESNASTIALIVKSTAPAPTYTFARPTSARLELTNDKGNGTDEKFTNDIERAFFVISGTYTGEVTEAIAKEYFAFAKYPFEFGDYTSTKDRTRRISIDTTAHTYTVKFDVTWLPVGEYFCRFNNKGGDGDLILSKEACPDNTAKSVGSTYTLTNYNGQSGAAGHWGCIVLKIERNYAVTGVTVQEESGKPTLTVSGTFDSAFTPEQIKKFLEDEDIRSMCVDLYGEGWNKVKTVVTTEAGKFTVKIDLSEVANGSYIVAIDASGYGNITMESITGTLSSGGKTYTLSVDGDKNVKLTIA